MLDMNDVIKKGNPVLAMKAKDVKLPLSPEDKKLGFDLLKFVVDSQDDELARKYGLRPAVGIAAPQIGVSKRMFAISFTDFNNKDVQFVFINPKITYKSKEMIYLDNGEGCLSVDEETTAATLRHQTIRISSYILDFKSMSARKVNMELKNYPAIVFQHENDHLDGILFTDKYTSFEDAKKLATNLYSIVLPDLEQE